MDKGDQGPIWKLECRRALPGETRVNGAGAPPVAALGIIGLVASRLPVNNKINGAFILIEISAGKVPSREVVL